MIEAHDLKAVDRNLFVSGDLVVADEHSRFTLPRPLTNRDERDVRDLAGWMVHLLENGVGGCFNAIGPAGSGAVCWAELIAACQRGARAIGREPAVAVMVSEALLKAQGVAPWRELPLWLPADDPEFAGFMAVDIGRAIAHGLRTRPLDETVQAVLAEPPPGADDPPRAGKLSPEREAELLRLASA